jgi:hypothetical protein
MKIVVRRLNRLLRAHRSGETGTLQLSWGADRRLTLELRGPYLVGVRGAPLLRGLAGAELACSGHLSRDIAAAVRAGVRPYVAAEHAQEQLTALLGRILTAPMELRWASPEPGPASHPLGLPVSLFALLSEALPLARPPESVARQFHHVLDHELLVARDSGAYRLDPVTQRTLGQAWRKPVLRQLILHSGRLEPRRTREAWRAFDLLYQLGLVQVVDCEELPRVPMSEDPHWLIPVDRSEPEPLRCGETTDDLNARSLDVDLPDEFEPFRFAVARKRPGS